ncbi:hypothetical protein NDU88_005023 [Pleurodeles waltl]|uniref:Uncharacterized protein n=1 Tax=Pleurodeles waltl TaxID=8319 RepID=A0AAV7T999_PLEWA|nr:hypothetical protein NDU88_005023 [Pleurodeles waltl]
MSYLSMSFIGKSLLLLFVDVLSPSSESEDCMSCRVPDLDFCCLEGLRHLLGVVFLVLECPLWLEYASPPPAGEESVFLLASLMVLRVPATRAERKSLHRATALGQDATGYPTKHADPSSRGRCGRLWAIPLAFRYLAVGSPSLLPLMACLVQDEACAVTLGTAVEGCGEHVTLPVPQCGVSENCLFPLYLFLILHVQFRCLKVPLQSHISPPPIYPPTQMMVPQATRAVSDIKWGDLPSDTFDAGLGSGTYRLTSHPRRVSKTQAKQPRPDASSRSLSPLFWIAVEGCGGRDATST